MQHPVRLLPFIEEHLSILLHGASTDIPTKRIAVILHLFYLDLWEEIDWYISNINPFPFDLYVTLVDEGTNGLQLETAQKKLLAKYPSAKIFVVKNRGLDIGGFIHILDYMINNNLEYDYIIKLHSKKSLHTADAATGNAWRKESFNTILGSHTVVERIHALLCASPDVGMVGSVLWNISTRKSFIMGYGNNYKMINDLAKEFKLTANADNFNFIAGTMFWADYESMVKPLRGIDRQAFLNRFETGACSDSQVPTLTHSMERILSLFILSDNKQVMGV